MKARYILPILFLISTFTFSQDFKEKKEKIKALKVAFLTEKLELTTDEAQKFWPIYNAFDDKQFELRHNKKRAFNGRLNDENIAKLTESEAKSLITEIEATEEEMHNLKKKFIFDLQKVLPAKKIILLRKSEDEFNRKLLKQFREKRK